MKIAAIAALLPLLILPGCAVPPKVESSLAVTVSQQVDNETVANVEYRVLTKR
jgi:hypothetical protein